MHIALTSYRRAFKMDPDIDRAYKSHYQTHIAPTFNGQQQSTSSSIAIQSQDRKEDDFVHLVPVGNEYKAPSASRKDPLEDLVNEIAASQPIEYIPFLDYKPVPVANVPGNFSSWK